MKYTPGAQPDHSQGNSEGVTWNTRPFPAMQSLMVKVRKLDPRSMNKIILGSFVLEHRNLIGKREMTPKMVELIASAEAARKRRA